MRINYPSFSLPPFVILEKIPTLEIIKNPQTYETENAGNNQNIKKHKHLHSSL